MRLKYYKKQSRRYWTRRFQDGELKVFGATQTLRALCAKKRLAARTRPACPLRLTMARFTCYAMKVRRHSKCARCQRWASLWATLIKALRYPSWDGVGKG